MGVQNLSCDPKQSEGFPTSGNDTENKHSISDALRSLPQGSSQNDSRGFGGCIVPVWLRCVFC